MPTQTELALIPEIDNPAEIFKAGGLDPILENIAAKVREMDLDISTDRGRKEIASVARKIASSKTYIDDAGKYLVAEWKDRAKLVDAERKRARDFLDALKEETRAPLTEWETRDQRRIEGHEKALADMADIQGADMPFSVAECRERLVKLAPYGQRDFEEFTQRADKVFKTVLYWLKVKEERAEKAEAEAAELARLRKEAAEREQRERDERIAQEAAERARLAAEGIARLEAERLERKAKEEAEEAAREAARQRHAEEQKRLRAEQEKMDAMLAAKASEERARKAEANRLATEARAKTEAERQKQLAEIRQQEAVEAERRRAEAERKAKEDVIARRNADLRHRERIETEAVASLVSQGWEQEQAENIVATIAGGEIKHITINY